MPTSRQRATVPSLLGKTRAQATLLLQQRGLRLGAVVLASSTRPKGTICEQLPAARSRVVPGTAVEVHLSRGPSDDPGVLKNAAEGARYDPAPRGKSVIRLPRQVEHPPTDFLRAVPGWRTTLLADGLQHPRWLTVAPSGEPFVVESRLEIKQQKQPNRVVVVEGGKSTVFADQLNLPFGIAFHRDYLYVANTGSVVRWPYRAGQRQASGPPEVVLTGIPERGIRQHWTRNLIFSPDGKWLYVTIGSKENAAIEEPLRGTIIRFAVDVTGKPFGKPTIYAAGMRNPIGMAFHPVTGQLWAVVSERDYLGDALVPDYLAAVHPGDYFGWPYYYLGPHHDPRLPERPDLRKKTRVPEVLFPAHSAPLGLVFDRTGSAAYVAFHGSQNRSRFTGYKVVRVPFDRQGRPSGKPTDFVAGWLVDPKNGNAVYGRPAGLAWDTTGALLIADDWGGRLWRVAPR